MVRPLIFHKFSLSSYMNTGNLNTRVLNLLRMSELESLDMTASMTDEEGLNLDAHELLLGTMTADFCRLARS